VVIRVEVNADERASGSMRGDKGETTCESGKNMKLADGRNKAFEDTVESDESHER
jgi:hypothetical protein